jgi:hypothetical protein
MSIVRSQPSGLQGRQRADGADTGARDDDIQPAEVLGGFTYRLGDAVEVAHIGAPPASDAVPTETLGLCGDCVGVEIQQGEVGLAGP